MRAMRMPIHSNECGSLTKIRTHDIDQTLEFNSRLDNEIQGINPRKRMSGKDIFFAADLFCRDESR
jgi:hypothetical protein